MTLDQLLKIKTRSQKRVGRGIGSGKGKTSSRGQKGQKARGKIPAAQVGGGLILYKKLPFRRGWGNRKVSPKPIILGLDQLNVFKTGSKVNLGSLVENGLVNQKEASERGVKILSRGKLDTALTVEIAVSKNVQKLIEKAGGQVVI